MKHILIASLLFFSCGAMPLFGQSSSLYVAGPAVRESAGGAEVYDRNGQLSRLSPAIAETSIVAVPLPAPRFFSEQDLVTVIIREETIAEWGSGLETEKGVSWDGELAAFPDIGELLQFTLTPGVDNAVEVDLTVDNEFEGDGAIVREESMVGRIQARVIDVKPNGTLVLEARKFSQIDEEKVTLVLTGICRAEDITVDNTILSSELYDLNLVKTHEGDLRRASQKGLITKILDLLLNF